jgi:hypothetical protein
MINLMETEIGPAPFMDDNSIAEQTRLMPCLIVLAGPDRDDEMTVLAAGECYLPRETAVKLRDELTRRLEAT